MPTQNLAIMFTDIKGFTERTSGTTRAGMKSLLADHDRLLVPVFQYFDGHIVKTIGDAFLVTFPSPTDAVLCGVTIQEVLRQHNLAADEERRLEVRVAINVGEVELKDNDVLGEAVNIAARLEGVTEAGEVYFTDAVYQTMNRSEAPSADVGEKVFKGIPHPVRVYRVVHEPGSELATRLANGVRLSERGPVLVGIRETIRKRQVKRNALIAAGIAAAAIGGVSLVLLMPGGAERAQHAAEQQLAAGQGAAALETLQTALAAQPADPALNTLALRAATAHLDALEGRGEYAEAFTWLSAHLADQPWLESLRPRLMALDARVAVAAAQNDAKQRDQYAPKAVKEFLARHAKDPQAPLAAEHALADDASSQTHVWLQSEALERGLAPSDEIFKYNTALQENDANIDWQLLDTSRALLLKHYRDRALVWVGGALAGARPMAFQNAWRMLEDTSDARLTDPYLHALRSLINAGDTAVVDATRTVIAAETDAAHREQALAFSGELVNSFPKYLNSGDARDAIARMREELAATWAKP